MRPYYQKLDLELSHDDYRFLNYLIYTYGEQATPFTYQGQKSNFYKDLFLTSIEKSYRDNILFTKISDLFVKGSEYNSVDWIYQYSQISMIENKLPVHYDKRFCAISIPLLPIVTPVKWYSSRDENDVVCEYYYDSPATLVNTRQFHGSPENQHKRIFFQIGGFTEEFEIVVKQLKNSVDNK